MTPLLATLRSLPGRPQVDVLLHQKVTRVVEGHPDADTVLALNRRGLALGAWAPGIRALRARGYDVVVNCGNWEAPSVTSALVARMVGPRAAVVGPAFGATGALHDVAVAPRKDTVSELEQRLHLLAPLLPPRWQSETSFRVPRTGPAVQAMLERLRGRRFAVVNPGGRLGYRCVDATTFAAAARAISAAGVLPLVTWGPGEEALAARVVADAPGAELAPPTTLDELAALMGAGVLTVCNNTGPMHLSVAVGAPTLALFLFMPIARWGYFRLPHRMLDLTGVAAPEARVEEAIRGLLAPAVIRAPG